MKKWFLSLVLVTSLTVHQGAISFRDADVLPKSLIFGGLGSGICAAMQWDAEQSLEQNFSKRSLIVSSALAGLVATGYFYLILKCATAEAFLEQGIIIIEEAIKNHPVIDQDFNNERELLAVLKTFYRGDMWLVEAQSALMPISHTIARGLAHITDAKSAARSDLQFLTVCNKQLEHGRKVLQNIAKALRMIDESIANNDWNKNSVA